MATKPPWVREELRRKSSSLGLVEKREGFRVSRLASAEGLDGRSELAEALERSASVIPNIKDSHDDVSLVALLKACTKQKDLYQGNILHAVVVKMGSLDNNIFVGNSLVNLYAKCGALETARKVLHELPVRDVVSWTALIGGFCEQARFEDALSCFDWMKLEDLAPDPTTLASILKACGNTRDVERGKGVHAGIVREGWLVEDFVLGSALLDMYAKCGALAQAQQVFNDLPARDLVSWNSLIAGYAQCGYCEKSLYCFQQALLEGLTPDMVTFTCLLKACASKGALEEGKRLHSEIAGKGLLGEDVVLGSALVDMYAKCGALAHAQQVFNELPSRNEVSWTGLITGFCQHMHGEEALACFELMKQDGFCPDRVTFACILKACGNTGAAEKGKEVHGEILRLDLLGKDTVLGNALVDMYGKFGALVKAQEVFDHLPVRNLVSWNALIAGYSQHGHGEEVLACFEQLKNSGLSPDAVTYACTLKSCGSIGAIEDGKEIHAEVARRELLEHETILGNALMDMYAKCGVLDMAHQVFGELPVRDVVSWNALINGYCEHGFAEQGLDLFEWMKGEGLHPDAVTFTAILKACGNIEAAAEGEEIHNEIVKKGLLERVNILGNALVAMYGNCGVYVKAQNLFEQLPMRDVVAWNTLIAGCCKFGHCKEALHLYQLMKCDSISPDALTFASILKACSMIGATEKGKEFFTEVIIKGLLDDCVMLGNAVVNTHEKCDLLVRAHEFDELQVRDVVSRNAFITGHCRLGLGEKASICFEQRQHESVCPDAATSAFLLRACGNMGATYKGQVYFESFIANFGIKPTLKHCISMAELFGCIGQLDKAAEVMKRLPYLPTESGVCSKSKVINIGGAVIEQAVAA